MRYFLSGLKSKFLKTNEDDVIISGRQRGPLKGDHKLAVELDTKLAKFREELHRSREEISKSYPQFEEIETSVRSSMAIDRFGRNPQNTLNSTERNGSTSYPLDSSSSSPAPSQVSRYVESELLKEWNALIFEAKEKLNASFKRDDNVEKSGPDSGILETDLDTGKKIEQL
jgi:hypothetical protein